MNFEAISELGDILLVVTQGPWCQYTVRNSNNCPRELLSKETFVQGTVLQVGTSFRYFQRWVEKNNYFSKSNAPTLLNLGVGLDHMNTKGWNFFYSSGVMPSWNVLSNAVKKRRRKTAAPTLDKVKINLTHLFFIQFFSHIHKLFSNSNQT